MPRSSARLRWRRLRLCLYASTQRRLSPITHPTNVAHVLHSAVRLTRRCVRARREAAAAATAAQGFVLVRDLLPYITLDVGPNGTLLAQLDESAVRARVAHCRITLPVLREPRLAMATALAARHRAWATALLAWRVGVPRSWRPARCWPPMHACTRRGVRCTHVARGPHEPHNRNGSRARMRHK